MANKNIIKESLIDKLFKKPKIIVRFYKCHFCGRKGTKMTIRFIKIFGRSKNVCRWGCKTQKST